LGKSNQAARKGTGPSKLATHKSNKENAIHAQIFFQFGVFYDSLCKLTAESVDEIILKTRQSFGKL